MRSGNEWEVRPKEVLPAPCSGSSRGSCDEGAGEKNLTEVLKVNEALLVPPPRCLARRLTSKSGGEVITAGRGRGNETAGSAAPGQGASAGRAPAVLRKMTRGAASHNGLAYLRASATAATAAAEGLSDCG